LFQCFRNADPVLSWHLRPHKTDLSLFMLHCQGAISSLRRLSLVFLFPRFLESGECLVSWELIPWLPTFSLVVRRLHPLRLRTDDDFAVDFLRLRIQIITFPQPVVEVQFGRSKRLWSVSPGRFPIKDFPFTLGKPTLAELEIFIVRFFSLASSICVSHSLLVTLDSSLFVSFCHLLITPMPEAFMRGFTFGLQMG